MFSNLTVPLQPLGTHCAPMVPRNQRGTGRAATKAWSQGERVPAAVLFQTEVVTASDPGAVIDGVNVDVDDVLAADFGQWDLPR